MQVFPIFNVLLHFVAVVLLAVGALLPIVNPLGGAPIFLAMTVGFTHEERKRRSQSERWARIMDREYRRLQQAERRGRRSANTKFDDVMATARWRGRSQIGFSR